YINDGLLYETSLDQVFPYIDIHYAPQLYVANRISRTAESQFIQQTFYYGKAVTNTEGLGFLGYGELIRSNMHMNNTDTNRNYTIGIQSPQLRGANVRTFLSKSAHISAFIKNMNLTNPPPVGGITDGASLTDYITRQDQLYYTEVLPNKTFVNVPITMSAKDLLLGTYNNQRLIY